MNASRVNDLSLEDLEKGIIETVKSVPMILNDPRYSDYVIIVFVGPTGSGKSTTLHILVKDKMFGAKTKKGIELICHNSKIPHVKIGSGYDAVTIVPNFYVDNENKLIFVDCPGLLDNEGPFQRILNAYAIHTVLGNGGKIKILNVIESDLFYSQRGKDVKQNFEMISQLIPDEDVLKQSLVLAITKTKKDYEINGFFEYLKTNNINCEEEEEENDDDYDEEDSSMWLIEHFLNEGKENVFMIPEAEEEGEYLNFKEFERVFRILKKNPADSPETQISLDDECIAQLKIIIKQLKNEIYLSLEHFKEKIPMFYERENDLSRISIISNNLKMLGNKAKQGLEEFSKQFAISFPNESNELKEKINNIIPWKNFLFDVLGDRFVKENFSIDLSSLISSLSGHLQNVERIEKQIREKEKEQKAWKSKIDEEQMKYKKQIKDLEERARNNEINQEQKQREFERMKLCFDEQTKEIERQRKEYEEKSQSTLNSILSQIKQNNENDRKSLYAQIDTLNQNFINIRLENIKLQQELQREREQREIAQRNALSSSCCSSYSTKSRNKWRNRRKIVQKPKPKPRPKPKPKPLKLMRKRKT